MYKRIFSNDFFNPDIAESVIPFSIIPSFSLFISAQCVNLPWSNCAIGTMPRALSNPLTNLPKSVVHAMGSGN
jgi:hypothetical protein